MSTCSRPTYGVAEIVALVLTILRPWLDAIRTEFAPAKPEALLPGPQPRRETAPEVPAASPVVETVAEVQAVHAVQVEPVQEVAELSPPAGPLYVRRGEGHKVRYVAWDGEESGHKYRRNVQPSGKATYKQVPPATYQHGIRRRVHS